MTRLLDEEIEEDEAFWGQDALKEVSRLVLKLLIFFSSWLCNNDWCRLLDQCAISAGLLFCFVFHLFAYFCQCFLAA